AGAPLAKTASVRRAGQYSDTAKRRTRRRLPPAASGSAEPGFARRRRAGERAQLDDSAGADVGGRVPAVRAAPGPDDVAGVRGVDELPAADVDPDVPEAVEEDEVAGLQLVARHGYPVAVLRRRMVRQGDAHLGEDVHDEPGAVEAARGRPAPHVRH